MVTFQELIAQVHDACFFLDGHGMVIGSVANCFLDALTIWLVDQYSCELINWSGFGAYRRWRQQMIHQDFVQVKMVSLHNVVVDYGCSV